MRSQHCISFEGFARYMMSGQNLAFVSERIMPHEDELDHPLAHYYVAASHNTYLTGHQLKGESSVELYSQVRNKMTKTKFYNMSLHIYCINNYPIE